MPAPKVAEAVQCEHCQRWHNVDDTSYIMFSGDVSVGGAGEHKHILLGTTEDMPEGEMETHYVCREPHCLMSIFDGVIDMMLTRKAIKPNKEQAEAEKAAEEEAKEKGEEYKKPSYGYRDTITLEARTYDRLPRQLLVMQRRNAVEALAASPEDSVVDENNQESSE